MSDDGKIIKVVALGTGRATLMNVGKHTIEVEKLGRVVAVVGGHLCVADVRCLWCLELADAVRKGRVC